MARALLPSRMASIPQRVKHFARSPEVKVLEGLSLFGEILLVLMAVLERKIRKKRVLIKVISNCSLDFVFVLGSGLRATSQDLLGTYLVTQWMNSQGRILLSSSTDVFRQL
jgi:hypothetical protein